MCRNIKTLRAPYAVGVTDDDVRAAALEYVRTVGGFRLPSPDNADAFNEAVETITAATRDLLARLDASPEQPAQQDASSEQPGGLAQADVAPAIPGGLTTRPVIRRPVIRRPVIRRPVIRRSVCGSHPRGRVR